MPRNLTVRFTFDYEITIDDDNYVVKDYDNDLDLLKDIASYRFSNVLPVMKSGGVIVNNVQSTIIEIVN